jgi:hypothetical protein
MPYIFSANSLIVSAQVNADFDTLYSTLNAGLDSTNFSALGLPATLIKPTTTAQATFGGSVPYTFPAAIFAGSGYVPPVLTASGTATAITEHIVRGSVTFSITPSNNFYISSLSFLSFAAFTSSSSYMLLAVVVSNALAANWPTVVVEANKSSGSSAQVIAQAAAYPSISFPLEVDWVAIGA